MTPHDAHRVIEEVLSGLPLRHKLTHLAASAMVEDAGKSVEFLIEVALVMARHLPVHQQTVIRWYLQEAISELKARWN
jgi:hypothetical protein